jgi:hypothetical protein
MDVGAKFEKNILELDAKFRVDSFHSTIFNLSEFGFVLECCRVYF